MLTRTDAKRILEQVRSVTPRRPLLFGEALRVAELQANRLLELRGFAEPGTPSELVTELPFVRVMLRENLPVSGSAQWIKPHWLILLNLSEPRSRRRFSLMHEFKHVIDHPYIDYLYAGETTAERERRAELVADHFAGCLLMPKRLVKRLWGEGVQNPSDLALRFSVSEPAMRFRLTTLGLTERAQRCALPRQVRPENVAQYLRIRRLPHMVRVV